MLSNKIPKLSHETNNVVHEYKTSKILGYLTAEFLGNTFEPDEVKEITE